MMLSATERTRVAKLLGLIGSQHDAEALAAARKAHHYITQRGATWLNLIGADDPSPEAPHVALAREFLSRGKGIITDWEHRFLVGIMSFAALNPKQAESLDSIGRKINISAP